jgi:transposase-like protein
VRELKAGGSLPPNTKLRSSKYLNNLIEQDHRGVKQRLLLLTFTRRAALEMTRRSQLILAEARGSAARDISTPSALIP